MLLRLSLLVLAVAGLAQAFYMPSAAPNDFKVDDVLPISVVKLTSRKTQLPYEYYSLPFCAPMGDELKRQRENLGEVLRGDRIMTSLYQVKVKRDTKCQQICVREFTANEIAQFVDKIREDYRIHMLLDSLPAALAVVHSKTKEIRYLQGIPIGKYDAKTHQTYIFNHLKINIKYHESKGSLRIIAFEVVPQTWSLDSITGESPEEECVQSANQHPQELFLGSPQKFRFSYEVTWKESEIEWSNRWDMYLQSSDSQYHWYSIINSIVIVFILSGIVALILIRSLRRDFARYNDEEFQDDAFEETGWKLVHGDAFRPPVQGTVFAAIVGSGVQIFGMLLVVLFCAALGMLSPASRGSMTSVAIALFVLMGCIAGYYSARVYRTIKGQNWQRAAFLTATVYPGVVFGTIFVVNFFVWGAQSSGAIPITTLFALLAMWLLASVPLTMLGYYFGFRKGAYEPPCRVNQIPRQVPEKAWYFHPGVTMFLTGILPFGAVFLELFYIFSALWDGKEYYLFGFLGLAFLILVVTIAENSIAMTYFYLSNEDYHWWWSSMLLGGGCSVYVIIFSIFYFFTKLEITSFVSTILYFSYTALISITFWLLSATIGFVSSLIFVRYIYASVKLE